MKREMDLGENHMFITPRNGRSSTSSLNKTPSVVEDTIASSPHLCRAPLCRQFWNAGNYEDTYTDGSCTQSNKSSLHVHPRFLHSNATSHKWVFGAIAELLDNAIDEIQYGATFVIVDKFSNPRGGNPALLIQDDGRGMDPGVLLRCMSFGFSDKSKSAIGQYGNGFKTSTMRLGADVIVFSRHTENRKTTQSIGLLSYTYLSRTGLDRIVVPMVHYELDKLSGKFEPLQHQDSEHMNLSIILEWSPFSTEEELLNQFDDVLTHGTKVIVYNLWEANDGALELDFETDPEDIRLRDFECKESGHYLTLKSEQHTGNKYHYSLRVYLSILYLRIPENFRMILCGRDVQHHSIANDLKFIEIILYKPHRTGEAEQGQVITTIGFLKEAPEVNVHGFNVYHKNRLILPFWHVITYCRSRGRGVVGVLEANFVQPTHSKQDFERTSPFQKLENRLKEMTWEYWNCQPNKPAVRKHFGVQPQVEVLDVHCGLIGYQVKNKLAPHLSSNDTLETVSLAPARLHSSSGIDSYSDAHPHAVKKKRSTGLSSEPGCEKGKAGVGINIVDIGHNMATDIKPAPSALEEGTELALTTENRKLQRRCIEHKQTLKELNQRVVHLKKEIEVERNKYAELSSELQVL